MLLCCRSPKRLSEATEFDWTKGAMAQGLAAYREGNFFLAHEFWEEQWRRSLLPEKTFVQALIQLSCAMHHHQRGNPRGAYGQLNHALVKLQDFPAAYGGLNVGALRDEMAGWIVSLGAERSAPTPPIPALRLL